MSSGWRRLGDDYVNFTLTDFDVTARYEPLPALVAETTHDVAREAPNVSPLRKQCLPFTLKCTAPRPEPPLVERLTLAEWRATLLETLSESGACTLKPMRKVTGEEF